MMNFRDPRRLTLESSTLGAYAIRKSRVGAAYGLLLCGLGCLTFACGEENPDRREWRPEDHQQPQQPDPTRAAPTEDQQPQSEAERNAQQARLLWATHCASCHGASGRGDGRGAPAMAQMPDLTSVEFQEGRSDNEIQAVIQNGRGLMPAFGTRLGERGVSLLVAYIRSLRAQPQ